MHRHELGSAVSKPNFASKYALESFFSKFVAIFADFNANCSDFPENTEKLGNNYFSKFLDFNLIFIMIIPQIYSTFDLIFGIMFDLIFDLIFSEPPTPDAPISAAARWTVGTEKRPPQAFRASARDGPGGGIYGPNSKARGPES